MTLKQANCIAVEHYHGKLYQCTGSFGHGGAHKFGFTIDQICCCQGDPCNCKQHAFSGFSTKELENISANKSKTISKLVKDLSEFEHSLSEKTKEISRLNKHINKLDGMIERGQVFSHMGDDWADKVEKLEQQRKDDIWFMKSTLKAEKQRADKAEAVLEYVLGYLADRFSKDRQGKLEQEFHTAFASTKL